MNDISVQRKARILVIQDDPILLALVSGTLRPEGLEIVVADDPMTVLALTRQDFQQIDLVITRINSKPISGLELAKRLARRRIQVPILFMSASHSLAAVVADSLGDTAVIEEPFTAPELRSSVKRCLSGRRRKIETPRTQEAGTWLVADS